MLDAAIFKNNQSQAVRLPKQIAFPDHVRRVEVRVVGSSRILSPVGEGWENWFENGTPVTSDFAMDRDQPAAQERQGF